MPLLPLKGIVSNSTACRPPIPSITQNGELRTIRTWITRERSCHQESMHGQTQIKHGIMLIGLWNIRSIPQDIWRIPAGEVQQIHPDPASGSILDTKWIPHSIANPVLHEGPEHRFGSHIGTSPDLEGRISPFRANIIGDGT